MTDRSLAAVAVAILLVPAIASTPTLTSTAGCALMSRGKSLDVRWYTAEQPRESLGVAEIQGGCPLRLGHLTSGTDLGTRIAFGDGVYQVGYYEDLRWTEHPGQYVQRALERALFESGIFWSAMTGPAPTLDVELLDFKEIKSPMVHAARVAVRVFVVSDAEQHFERTVVVSQPVAGDRFDDFVAAMARALQETANEVASVTSAAAGCR